MNNQAEIEDVEVDVTEEFLAACKELSCGELAACKSFSLLSAMSAIELLDPKMDSGMTPHENDINLSGKNSVFIVKEMEPQELIATIDGTFAMLVCWLHAQPLDQTFYTNICLLHSEELEDVALSSFSTSAIALLNDLKGIVEVAGVFNEEDFSPFSCHPNLHFSGDCVERLEIGLSSLSSRIESKAELPRHVEAVELRLKFMQSLFEVLHHLIPPNPPAADCSTKPFVPNFKKAGNAVDKCLLLVKLCAKTIPLGLNPLGNNSLDSDFSWLRAFHPQVNRQFSPPSFPREPKLISRVDSYVYLQNLLENVKRMIVEIPEKTRDLGGLLRLFRDFGGEDSCILSRSIVQLIVMPNDYNICGAHPLSEIVQEAVSQFDLSFESSLNFESSGPPIAIANGEDENFQNLIAFSVRAFVGIFQTNGHNLARQRDKLLRNCFEDLSVLSVEADKMEVETCSRNNGLNGSYPKPPIFSTFLLYHILCLMHYHFELGFRLELFVPYEFCYCYWYFGEIVVKSLINIQERKCNLMILNYSKGAAVVDKKKKSARKQLSKQKAEIQLRMAIAQMQKKILMHKIEATLSSAIVKFSTGLEMSGRLQIPDGEWARYHRRMSEFSSLPSMLYVSYDEYRSVAGQYKMLGYQKCFGDAATNFEQAVSYLKNIESPAEEPQAKVSSLLKLAKQNAVVAKLLSTTQLSNKRVLLEFPQLENLMFPIIKLG